MNKQQFYVKPEEKLLLTPKEASAWSGIGINRMKELLREDDCPFLTKVGNRYMVNRQRFEEYMRDTEQV